MTNDETWEKWCKVAMEARPDWIDGADKMYTHWHLKNYCFKDCKHKTSHLPSKDIPAAKEEEFKNWMTAARAKMS